MTILYMQLYVVLRQQSSRFTVHNCQRVGYQEIADKLSIDPRCTTWHSAITSEIRLAKHRFLRSNFIPYNKSRLPYVPKKMESLYTP
jgi:hypothetical protein